MTLSPGDTIQILFTTGGVTYAKTRKVEGRYASFLSHYPMWMMQELLEDIRLYANEGEAP